MEKFERQIQLVDKNTNKYMSSLSNKFHVEQCEGQSKKPN